MPVSRGADAMPFTENVNVSEHRHRHRHGTGQRTGRRTGTDAADGHQPRCSDSDSGAGVTINRDRHTAEDGAGDESARVQPFSLVAGLEGVAIGHVVDGRPGQLLVTAGLDISAVVLIEIRQFVIHVNGTFHVGRNGQSERRARRRSVITRRAVRMLQLNDLNSAQKRGGQ
jgi:hypothetical protein